MSLAMEIVLPISHIFYNERLSYLLPAVVVKFMTHTFLPAARHLPAYKCYVVETYVEVNGGGKYMFG